ncbi:hypothetical protein BDA96_07G215200 [Sorghum bicolor]|uniref:Uncharacterized protein n=1 Tax=Sorghum bicolor TaxID=4558 RepID=A0A921QQG1_SORBI|nr:hypothetical protein BDA96_07G215200 [Sorghum bicolor]
MMLPELACRGEAIRRTAAAAAERRLVGVNLSLDHAHSSCSANCSTHGRPCLGSSRLQPARQLAVFTN